MIMIKVKGLDHDRLLKKWEGETCTISNLHGEHNYESECPMLCQ